MCRHKIKPNLVQTLLYPTIFSFIIVGAGAWLFSLIKIDNEFLIVFPIAVTIIGFGCMMTIIISLIGIFWCFYLLVKIIMENVPYDAVVQALEKEYHRIKKE